MVGASFAVLIGLILALVLGCLVLIFVAVPILRGVGGLIAALFKGIGWVLNHIFDFIGGMLRDSVRFVGAIIAMTVLAPLVPLSVIIGRWSAAGHYANSIKRECGVGVRCLYRVALQRPLRLLLLDGLLEGLEQRVPEAIEGAPTSDRPRRATGKFEGYEIVGSLRGGGSGGRLYIAAPSQEKRARLRNMPERVVIKSFALSDGSSLPQIVRESRALECARQLGLVVDHAMDEHRFFYVMPYIPGDHMGILTRQLHGESDGSGLNRQQLSQVMHYIKDLLATLSTYHKAGLWHKDVKPENVIIHDDRAHLVDLGLVTPLRSAMTLTTHGTEYFRDPEMVRQALRGVKVHQVDGAKFDIYAVGAVLYFMLENTFPAHSGLSAFTKKSPEALRWIVRRSMADYNKRYASANVMLADLEYVSRAPGGDPFAVKPADLPSMRAADGREIVETIQTEPPPIAPAVAAAAVEAAAHSPQGGGAADAPIKPQRPRIRVTNWWTGEYVVDGAQGRDVDGGPQPAVVNRARTPHPARASARDQLRSARARAADIRHRVKSNRPHRSSLRAEAERQPSPAVITLSLIALAVVGLIVWGALLPGRRNATQRNSAVVINADSDSLKAALNAAAGELRDQIVTIESPREDFRVLVINASDAVTSGSALSAWSHDVAAEIRDRRVEIKPLTDRRSTASARAFLPQIASGRDGRIRAIDSLLDQNDCSMLAIVTGDPARPLLTYRAATTSVSVAAANPAYSGPPRLMAVLNEHPLADDQLVKAHIESEIKTYRQRGYEQTPITAETEAKLIALVARYLIDPKESIRQELQSHLAEAGLDAMLHFGRDPDASDGGAGRPTPTFIEVQSGGEEKLQSAASDSEENKPQPRGLAGD